MERGCGQRRGAAGVGVGEGLKMGQQRGRGAAIMGKSVGEGLEMGHGVGHGHGAGVMGKGWRWAMGQW